MPHRHGRNEPPVLDVDVEMRLAEKAGVPFKMVDPEDPIEAARDVGGTFPHYHGSRDRHGNRVVVRVSKADGERIPLDPRFDLANHSPDGFEWGYAGSGPAQLALAILADFLEDDQQALALYQRFKARWIATIQLDRWRYTAPVLRDAIETLRREDSK